MSDKNLDVGITIRTHGGKQSADEINKISDSTKNAGNAAQGANRQFASMGSALSSLSGVIASLGIAALGRDLVRTVEQVQNMDIRLKGLTKSAQDYAQVQSYLSDVSARHHKSQLALADSFSKLLTLEQAGLVTRKQSIALLEGMSNAASKTGASTEQLKQLMFGFAQAMGSGVVHMEELNQVTEPMPGLMNEIAKAAGYSVGEFRNLVAEGKITSEVFGKIMVSAFNSYQGAAEAAGETLTAKYADINNAWLDLARVVESPIADALTPVLQAISGSVTGLAQDFRELKALKNSIFSESSFNGINTILSAIPSARITKNTGGASGDWGGSDGATGSWGDSKTSQNSTRKETEALRKEIEALRKEIEATATTKKNTAVVHHAASQHIAKGMSDEQKAANELSRAYQNLDESLRKQLFLSKNTDNKQAELEYDLESGALRNLNEQKKLHLLQTQAEIDNNESIAKADEAKKSQLEQLTNQYNQLTLSAKEYFKTQLDSAGIKGAAQAPVLAQFDKNTAAEAQKKALDESRQAMQDYVNEVDNAKSGMDGLAASSSDVFNASLGGINQLVGALDSMVSGLQKNAGAFDELAKKKKLLENVKLDKTSSTYMQDLKLQNDTRKKYEVDYQNLQNDTINQYIGGVQTMAGAAASMFQDSEEAQLAAQAVALVTLGIQAVQAIVTQGQGEPYTAFARIAAMAAIVGSMVSSVGGNSPGAGSSSMPKGSRSTGTVLGDTSAESNSVGNVYELLKTIHAEEYVELRGINKGVNDLKGGISNTLNRLFQTGGVKDANTHLANFTNVQLGNTGGIVNFDPILNYLLKGIFGTVKEKVIGGGISTDAFSMGDDVTGQSYTTIEKTKKSWFSKKTSYRTVLSELDQGVENALTNVFKSMGDTMIGIAGSLGKAMGADIGNRVSEYIVPSMQIELRGLSGEDAAKKLNGVISAALDTMSNVVFGDIVGQYQKLGEGMLETAIRIVSEVAVVRDALNQSGLKMADNAIELSDSLVQAAGGLEQFQQQFEDFYDKFYTGIEKQNRLQTRLNETFAEVSMVLPNTRETYKNIIEALNLNNSLDRERYSLMLQLADAADQYYSAIETSASNAKDLSAAMRRQEIYLMEASGDKAGALAAQREDELAAMDESMREMQNVIYLYQDMATATSNMATATSTLNTTYTKAANLLVSTFNKFNDLSKSLRAFRDALKVGDLSTGSPESKYNANKAAFEANAKVIAAGGNSQKYKDALSAQQDIVQNFLSSSRDYNASGMAYGNDFKTAISSLTKGSVGAKKIATDAEKQLNSLNKVVSTLGLIKDAIIKLNSSNGITGAVDSVGDAIKGVTAAIAALNDAQKEQEKILKAAKLAENKSLYNRILDKASPQALAAQFDRDNTVGHPQSLKSYFVNEWGRVYKDVLGSFNEKTTASQWTKIGSLLDELLKDNSLQYQGKPTVHPIGYYNTEARKIQGSHKDGLNFVPFDGYLAELHRGERVQTASEARNSDAKKDEETRRIFNEILAELKAANKQRGAVAVELIKKADKAITNSEAQTRAIKRIEA